MKNINNFLFILSIAFISFNALGESFMATKPRGLDPVEIDIENPNTATLREIRTKVAHELKVDEQSVLIENGLHNTSYKNLDGPFNPDEFIIYRIEESKLEGSKLEIFVHSVMRFRKTVRLTISATATLTELKNLVAEELKVDPETVLIKAGKEGVDSKATPNEVVKRQMNYTYFVKEQPMIPIKRAS